MAYRIISILLFLGMGGHLKPQSVDTSSHKQVVDSNQFKTILNFNVPPDTLVNLSPYIEFWIDSSYVSTWERVESIPYFTPFESGDKSTKKKLLFVDQNLWVRFKIFNHTNDKIEMTLLIDKVLTWSSRIKVINSNLEILNSSTHSRQILCHEVLFPPASASTIYLKIDFRYFGVPDSFFIPTKNCPVRIGLWPKYSFEKKKEEIRQRKGPELTLHSMVVGVLGIILMISLFQFFLLSETVYLAYAAYLSILLLYLCSWYNNINFNSTYFIPFPLYLKNEAEIFCFYSGYCSYFIFLLYFFKAEKISSRANTYFKVMLFFTIFLGVSNLISLLLFKPSIGIIFYVTARIIYEILNFITIYLMFRVRSLLISLISFGALFLSLGITLSFTLSFTNVSRYNIFANNMVYLYMAIILEVFFFTIALGYKFKLLKEENFANQKRVIQSEIDTLRIQINPHLIFNGLTVAGGAMLDSPINGIRYITAFANYLRNVLENSRHSLIPLSKEIEMLEQYIFVEQTRKPNTFQFKIEIDSSADTEEIMVPPTILQPYVENTINHGFDDFRDDFMLSVRCWVNHDFLYITLTDNGIGRDAAQEKNASRLTGKKESLGLKITQERIQMSGGAFNPTNEVQIKDLKDDSGKAIGTSVIIKITIF